MADRIFKGRLICTGDIHDENVRAFPEALEDFQGAKVGQLDPFQMIYNILRDLVDHQPQPDYPIRPAQAPPELVREVNGSIWVMGTHGNDTWIKIDRDGSIEIGASGV